MKSKTILPEGIRLSEEAVEFSQRWNNFNADVELCGKYHSALVAAEQELCHKDIIIKGYIFNEEQFESEILQLKENDLLASKLMQEILNEKDKEIKQLVLTIVNYKSQNEEYKDEIERLNDQIKDNDYFNEGRE